MKVALDIKNMSRLIKPTENDVIIYDGKQWYVTTKGDLLKEAHDMVEECRRTLNEIKAENQEFKRQTSKDINDLVDTTRKLLDLKGDNL